MHQFFYLVSKQNTNILANMDELAHNPTTIKRFFAFFGDPGMVFLGGKNLSFNNLHTKKPIHSITNDSIKNQKER
jgi:hypothetical protein